MARPRAEDSTATWRQVRSTESAEFHRLRMRAAQRAKQRLAERHPKEFQKLLREERKALGVPFGVNAKTALIE